MATAPPKAANLVPALSPLSLLRMFWKRKTLVLLIWTGVSIVALVVVARIPPVYKAEALIVVDSQKIPDRYVASTVVSDAEDRVATISHEILSTGRLEKIIDDFDLYHSQRQTLYMEQVLQLMRNDIEVAPEKASLGHSIAFRISYQGPTPAIVAQVTNRIANLYVEENLKTREVQAEGTSEFIENQLKEAKQKLDQLETALSRYKVSHNGELPQQEGSLNGILSRLQVALEANRDAINRAEQHRLMLQDSLGVAESALQVERREFRQTGTVLNNPGASSAGHVKRSAILQAQLDELRLHYSDEHPDVKRLQYELGRAKAMEAQQAADRPVITPSTAHAPTTVPDPPELLQARERIASIKSQLTLAAQELDKRKTEQQRILSDIAAYQARINELPIREQEMSQLMRDYDICKANYRSLLDKKIAAGMAADMERRQKSERFTIVDPARPPAIPARPKRALLDAGGSFAGLLFGLALAFGKELQEGTLLGEWELPKTVPVLGRLPFIKVIPATSLSIQNGSAAASRKWKLALLSSALLSIIGMVLAGFYLVAHYRL
jgi:succinoglycan biosynthesis transport protein ExoP